MALSNRLVASHQIPTAATSRFDLAQQLRKFQVKFYKRRFSAERMQLADVSRALALLLENGLPVTVALRWLTPRLSGEWHAQFNFLVRNLDLGADLVEELTRLDARMPIVELTELTQKLRVSIERGTPISHQVAALADSIQQQVIRDLIRRAGQNETKMLIPTIFLILPVTILFAIFPSLLVLQSNY